MYIISSCGLTKCTCTSPLQSTCCIFSYSVDHGGSWKVIKPHFQVCPTTQYAYTYIHVCTLYAKYNLHCDNTCTVHETVHLGP